MLWAGCKNGRCDGSEKRDLSEKTYFFIVKRTKTGYVANIIAYRCMMCVELNITKRKENDADPESCLLFGMLVFTSDSCMPRVVDGRRGDDWAAGQAEYL